MKIINKIKKLPRWTLVAGLLMVSYVVFFKLPELWSPLKSIWYSIQSLCFGMAFRDLIRILLDFTGIVIWILSVLLCIRLVLFAKKRAYAFLLAYLLVYTVTAPLAYVAQKISYSHRQHQNQQMLEGNRKLMVEEDKVPMQLPMLTMSINYVLPVGPILLLMALWYMWKSENSKKDEQ